MKCFELTVVMVFSLLQGLDHLSNAHFHNGEEMRFCDQLNLQLRNLIIHYSHKNTLKHSKVDSFYKWGIHSNLK